MLYWSIGSDILTRQKEQGWGAKVIDRLAQDLRHAFPAIKGFSARNLKYMRKLAEAYPDPEFVQQAVAQIPWDHHLILIDKIEEPGTASGTFAGPWRTTGPVMFWRYGSKAACSSARPRRPASTISMSVCRFRIPTWPARA